MGCLLSRSTLFPYTTLFRSERQHLLDERRARVGLEQRIAGLGDHHWVEHDLALRVGPEPVMIAKSGEDRKSTRLNSSHTVISYAGFCLKKKKREEHSTWNLS